MKKKNGNFLIFVGVVFIVVAAGIMIYNVHESMHAARMSDSVLQQIKETVVFNADLEQENASQQSGVSDEMIPEYILFPEKEMPVIKIGEYNYVGFLEIPDAGLVLPVLAGEWSYAKLKIAPCVYAGSIYQDNMVIAAHNFRSHFSKIKNLKEGASVVFTDCEGNVFKYSVGWVDILQRYDTDEMKKAETWDLSLFTCTYGGGERYTVRCIKDN